MTSTIKTGLEVGMYWPMSGRNGGLAARLAEFALFFVSVAPCSVAQKADLSPTVQAYVTVKAGKVLLTHVRVIDGSGAPALEDRNLTIENGKITAIKPGTDLPGSAGENLTVLDLRGHSVIPGIVGMHDHLFYIARPNLNGNKKSEEPFLTPQMTFSSPRLYLASGVTTMRTTGSVETYTDLNLRDAIDAGQLPGPHMDVTGPYLDGPSFFLQEHFLK